VSRTQWVKWARARAEGSPSRIGSHLSIYFSVGPCNGWSVAEAPICIMSSSPDRWLEPENKTVPKWPATSSWHDRSVDLCDIFVPSYLIDRNLVTKNRVAGHGPTFTNQWIITIELLSGKLWRGCNWSSCSVIAVTGRHVQSLFIWRRLAKLSFGLLRIIINFSLQIDQVRIS
jgi:hypothetical protein